MQQVAIAVGRGGEDLSLHWPVGPNVTLISPRIRSAVELRNVESINRRRGWRHGNHGARRFYGEDADQAEHEKSEDAMARCHGASLLSRDCKC